MKANAQFTNSSRFQVHYRSCLFEEQSFSFPCDERGNVDMNCLCETRRADFLFARMMARLEHTRPEIVVSGAAAKR